MNAIEQLLTFRNQIKKNVKMASDLIDHQGEKFFIVMLLLGVMLLTWLRISGTSVGIYHLLFYGNETRDPNLIFGQPRIIRSDEFTVTTPWTASQTFRNFPQVNDLYGISGQTFLFNTVPVKDFTIFFMPENWGFILLSFDQAFAFRWWFRAAMFLLATYLILKRISQRHVLFSILGALTLFFSPYIQWWYSVSMLDIVTFSLLLIDCFIRLVNYQTIRQLFFFSGLFAYLGMSWILLFYPPTQIVFAWLIVLSAFSFLWQLLHKFDRHRFWRMIASMIGSAFFIVICLLAFFIRYRPMVDSILNTAYPGQRVLSGGGYSFLFLLGGFFNIQLLNNNLTFPPFFSTNQSMASNFFLYALFLLPVLIYSAIWSYPRDQKKSLYSGALAFIFILFTLWQVYGIPLPFSKLLLVSSVPSLRVLLALGVLNIVLITWYLFQTKLPENAKHSRFFLVYAGIIFLFYLGFGYYLKSNFPGFISSDKKIIFIALSAGLGLFFLLLRRRILFILLLLCFSFISSYRVNPIYLGMGELTSGQLAGAVKELHKNDPDFRWIIYDSPIMLNYLQANGSPALSGTYYYPDKQLWERLDPAGKNDIVYNRYARVLFRSTSEEYPRFELTYRDAFSIFINPCSDLLVDLQVKYHVSPYVIELPCLQLVKQIQYPSTSFWIYERKPAGPKISQ